MNKPLISAISLIILSALLLSSCSISSDASYRSASDTDDVEITEGPDGVKIVKVKKNGGSHHTKSTITTVNGVSVIEYDDIYTQKPKKRDRGETTETRNIEGRWKGLMVSHNIDVTYTPAPSYGPVKITCEKWLQDYVEVKINGTELNISLKNFHIPEVSNGVGRIKVSISGPAVQTLGASGAASIKVAEDMNVQSNFYTSASGASSIRMKKLMTNGDVQLSLSGASSLICTELQCVNASLSVSGASSMKILQDIEARAVTWETSGASSAILSGQCSSVSLSAECSGASSTTINRFDGSWMEMTVGGASKGNVTGVACNKLYVDVSGASNAKINAFDGTTLVVESSGTSSATVTGIKATTVTSTVGYTCTIVLGGTTEKAQLTSSNGSINGSQLKADKAYVELNGDKAKITVKADKIFTND